LVVPRGVHSARSATLWVEPNVVLKRELVMGDQLNTTIWHPA
jgi:hypothetical protein